MPSVAIVGAGIVGLTTADHIQTLLPHAKVTVIADKFNADTTSDGAAGLLLPASNFRGPSFAITKDWIAYSYKYYEQLLHEDCGVYEICGYMLSSRSEDDVKASMLGPGDGLPNTFDSLLAPSQHAQRIVRSDARFNSTAQLKHNHVRRFVEYTQHDWLDVGSLPSGQVCLARLINDLMDGVAPVFRPATHQELLEYPGNWKYGSFMKTLLIRCRTFLPWLMKRIKARGGTVVKKTVHDLAELSDSYDLVVNCTGLESRWLCDDIHVAPIRGQLIKVKAPTVDKFYFGDGPDTYIIPNADGLVTLGGTCQYNVWDTAVRPHDAVGIRARCASILPILATSPVAWEWAGLRPYRYCVRVEPEIRGKLKIVHNYGHGGYGITSGPGTARDAAQLVLQFVNTQSKL